MLCTSHVPDYAVIALKTRQLTQVGIATSDMQWHKTPSAQRPKTLPGCSSTTKPYRRCPQAVPTAHATVPSCKGARFQDNYQPRRRCNGTNYSFERHEAKAGTHSSTSTRSLWSGWPVPFCTSMAFDMTLTRADVRAPSQVPTRRACLRKTAHRLTVCAGRCAHSCEMLHPSQQPAAAALGLSRFAPATAASQALGQLQQCTCSAMQHQDPAARLANTKTNDIRWAQAERPPSGTRLQAG